jgi:hypothetical protein
MHDSARVNGFEPAREFERDEPRDARFDPNLAQRRSEIGPVDVLLAYVAASTPPEAIVYGDHVLVLDAAGRLRLAFESRDELGVVGALAPQRFEHDGAIERGLAGEEDDPHAAAPDLALDLVATDCL